jgi:hypothetical protein
MGAKEIIVAVLVLVFAGFAVAFGIWSAKSDGSGERQAPKGK